MFGSTPQKRAIEGARWNGRDDVAEDQHFYARAAGAIGRLRGACVII